MKNNSITVSLREAIAQYLFESSEYLEAAEIAMGLEDSPSIGEVRSLLIQMTREGEVLEIDGKYNYLLTKETSSPITARVNPSLTEQEKNELELLKNNVKKGLYVMGASLGRIRNKRLFRDEYDTFEEFCQSEFGYSRRYVDYLIMGAEIVEDIKIGAADRDFENNCSRNSLQKLILPTSEAQTRSMIGVPKGERADCWFTAVERCGGSIPPAKVVKEVVKEKKIVETPAKYVARSQRLSVHGLVKISAKYNPELKPYAGAWGQVVSLEETTYTVLTWRGAVSLLAEQDLELIRDGDEELGRSLLRQLNQIRLYLEDGHADPFAWGLLNLVGKTPKPETTSVLQRMLDAIKPNHST